MEGGPLIMQPVVVVVVATCLLGNLSTPRLSSNKAVTSGSCKYDKNITDLKLTDIKQGAQRDCVIYWKSGISDIVLEALYDHDLSPLVDSGAILVQC